MKIKTIDKPSCKVIRNAMNKALENAGEDLGLSFKATNASYDPDGKTATFKVEIATMGDDGVVSSKEAENFKRFAEEYDLKVSDLNAKVMIGGNEFTIRGLNPRAHKNPINLTRTKDGKRFKASPKQVKMGMR